MLKIKVNGREETLNVGCRTSVNLDVLIKILGAEDQQVTLNSARISNHEYGTTTVNSGDVLLLNGK